MPELSAAVPELPVRSVVDAQAEYRDTMGFEIAWTLENDGIGAVAHGECAVFFRQTETPITPVTLWVRCTDLDAAHDDLAQRGANVIATPAQMPWGLRQFTVQDSAGHRMHFHAG